jgi:HEAT repeat protein
MESSLTNQPADTPGPSPSAARAANPTTVSTLVWDLPDPGPMTPAALEMVIQVARSFRLAGVQLRLYPPPNAMGQHAVHAAHETLAALLAMRPSFAMTSNGLDITFDGEVLRRFDLLPTARDLTDWMRVGDLGVIGFAPGVQEYEVYDLLSALMQTDNDGVLAFARIQSKAPTHIRVFPRSSSLRRPQLGDVAAGEGPDSLRFANQTPPGETPGQAVIPPMEHYGALDADGWAALRPRMNVAPIEVRRTLMVSMAQWLHARPDEAQTRAIDTFICERLAREIDTYTLQETVTAAESRLKALIARHDLAGVTCILHTVEQRLLADAIPQHQGLLRLLQQHVAESAGLRELIEHAVHGASDQDAAREVIAALGNATIRPLIASLKLVSTMQERMQLVALLKTFGQVGIPALIEELNAPNPWYVYRNVLSVLADVGTPATLGALVEKTQHDEPQVRMEAMTAAVRIAQSGVAPYLLRGMADRDAAVRACAASLAGACNEPPVLPALTRMLAISFAGGMEPEPVQIAACRSLGHLPDAEAYRVLIGVVRPPFRPFGGPPDLVRMSAVEALAPHMHQPDAAQAIQHALRDRAPMVRQAAQRAWDLYTQSSGQGEPG